MKPRLLSVMLISLLLALPLAIDWPRIEPEQTLREIASARGLLVGVSVGGSMLDDPRYARLLSREFNALTPENAMKFAYIHPYEGIYDYTEADRIVEFAEANGMQVRGHTLVWQLAIPEWVSGGNWTPAELEDILHEHITQVVGHYAGRVYSWDVVNEGLNSEGVLADNFWYRALGPGYIDKVFQWAHEADPQARLFYNETLAEGLGTKSDGVYQLLQDLLARGVPVNGVGLQMHTGNNWWPPADIEANIRRLAALGLEVQITELDVRLPEQYDRQDLLQQAETYRQTAAACLHVVGCTAIITWGLGDGDSWIPYFFPGWDHPLLFNDDYRPKPAYQAFKQALEDYAPTP